MKTGAAGQDGEPSPARELRLALAMRGGVSLAVWIGGTCAEIDQVRRAEAGGFWRRVVDSSDYQRVVVDILAGASAGGLNGAIYAASQVYGFPMEDLQDLWVRLGDTDSLVRRDTDGKERGWPSLFKGDDYFFAQVEEKLRGLVGRATAPDRPPAVALRLSGTLVEPIRRPGRSPSDEQLTHLRYESGFSFSHPWYSWLSSDFPVEASLTAGGPQPWSSRLALAARSTSSFPGAFEAAAVRSSRVPNFGSPAGDPGVGLSVDMGGVFLDRQGATHGSDVFLVSDGGILDNIPLGRALDAIAQAPADAPTDRFLVYVQPGIPATPTTPVAESLEKRRATISVARGVLGARLRAEGILGDLTQLDEYNTRIHRAATLRRSTFESLPDPASLLTRAGDSWPTYRRMRAEGDQRLVFGLLEDPIGYLGEDPFPRAVGTTEVRDDRWRSPWDDPRPPGAGFIPPSREALAELLTDAFTQRLPADYPTGATGDSVVTVGALPLMRICQLLIEWAQYLESAGGGAVAASDHKATLYRVQAFAGAGIDRPRRLAWVTLAATLPGGRTDSDLVTVAAEALAGLTQVAPADASAICDALMHESPAVLGAAITARVAAVNAIPDQAWSQPVPAAAGTGLVDLRREILDNVLVTVAQQLRDLSPAEVAGPPPRPSVGWYLDRVMPDPVTSDALGALEVVTFPEFATGLPGRRPVRFRRLSSANPTPLAPHFTTLLGNAATADGPHAGKWWDPANPGTPAENVGTTTFPNQQGIHVDLKLAGNDLSNFSAFLDAKWRRNDWMWGCLDAVPTLIDLLVTPESLATRLGTAGDPAAAVSDLVLGPAPGEFPLLRAFLAANVMTPPVRESIAAELDQVFPAVRSANPGPEPRLTRNALVAARQWEIVARRLVPNALSGVTGRTPTAEEASSFTRQLAHAVGDYNVGAEDMRSARPAPGARQRLAAISDASTRVLLYNAQWQWPTRFGLPNSQPSIPVRLTQRLARFAGRRAANWATRPR